MIWLVDLKSDGNITVREVITKILLAGSYAMHERSPYVPSSFPSASSPVLSFACPPCPESAGSNDELLNDNN